MLWLDRLLKRISVVEWKDRDGLSYLTEETDMNGKCHGLKIAYNHKGIKTSESSFEHGKLHGPTKYYDEDGNQLSEFIYRNNVLVKHDS